MDVVHFDFGKNADPNADITIDTTTEVSFNKPGQFNLNGGIIPRQVKQLGDPMKISFKRDDSVQDYYVEPSYSSGEYIFTEKLMFKQPAENRFHDSLNHPVNLTTTTYELVNRDGTTSTDSIYMEETVQPWNSYQGFINNVNDSLYRAHTGFHYFNKQGTPEAPNEQVFTLDAGLFVTDTFASTVPSVTDQDQRYLQNRNTWFNPSSAYHEYILRNKTGQPFTFNLILTGSYIDVSRYNPDFDHDKKSYLSRADMLDRFNITDATASTQDLGTFTLKAHEVKRLAPVMYYDKNGNPLEQIFVVPALKQATLGNYKNLLPTSLHSHLEILYISFGYKIADEYFRQTPLSYIKSYEETESETFRLAAPFFNFQYNYTIPHIISNGRKVNYLQDIRDAPQLHMNDTAFYRLNLSETREVNVSRAPGLEGTIFEPTKKSASLQAHNLILYNKPFGASFSVSNDTNVYEVSATNLTEANGYHEDQVITISGTKLSGTDPTNNLTLTLPEAVDGVFTLTASDISGTPNSNLSTSTLISDISNLHVIFDTGYTDYSIKTLNVGDVKQHVFKGTELGGTAANDLTFETPDTFSGTKPTLSLKGVDLGTPLQTTGMRDLQSGLIVQIGETDAIYNDLQYIMATVGNDFTGEQSSTNTTTQRGNYVVYIPVDKDDDQNYHDVMSNVGPLQVDNNNNRVKVDFKGVCYNPTTGEVEYVPLKNSNKRKRMIHINAEMKL